MKAPVAVALAAALFGCHGSSNLGVDATPPGPDASVADATMVPDAARSNLIDLGSDAPPFDFGDNFDLESSVIVSMTVVNPTSSPTGQLDVHLTGTDPGDFDIVQPATDCDDGIILLPNSTCTIQLRFRALSSGAKSATLVVTEPGGLTSNLPLLGRGVTEPVLDPPYHDFSVIELGMPRSESFTLTNTSTFDLTIASLTLANPIGSGFSISSTTCSGTLLADATCTIDVLFAPTALGQDSGELRLVTNHGTMDPGVSWVMGYGATRVSIAKAGSGTGTVVSSGGGVPDIDCGATCSGLWQSGGTWTMTATPSANSVLTGWSEPTCSATSTTCAVPVGTSPVTLTVTFDLM